MKKISLVFTALCFFLGKQSFCPSLSKSKIICAGLTALAINQGWHTKVTNRWEERIPKNLVQFNQFETTKKEPSSLAKIDLNISLHGVATFFPPVTNPSSFEKYGFCFWDGKTRPHKIHNKVELFTQEELLSEIENNKTVDLMFCWNGQLAYSYRLQAAKQLYQELRALENFLISNGYQASFNINAHSHGGNVALMLALIHDKEKIKLKNKIKCLSTFGTPVQEKTQNLVNHQLFEKFQHFYFAKDVIQVMDRKNLKLKPSKRFFPESILNEGKNRKQYLVKGDKDILNHFTIFYSLRDEILKKASSTPEKSRCHLEIEIDLKKYPEEIKKRTFLGLAFSTIKQLAKRAYEKILCSYA